MRLPSYSAVRRELNSVGASTQNGSTFGCFSNTYALTHSAFGMALMAMLNIFPISMIVIGVLNYDECTAQPYLPIWLIALGVLLIVKYIVDTSIHIYKVCRHRETDHSIYNLSPVDWIFTGILMLWLLIGAYWLHSSYGSVQYEMEEYSDYCDLLTFGTVFVIVTLVAAAILMFSCCSCFCFAVLACKKKFCPNPGMRNVEEKWKRNSGKDAKAFEVDVEAADLKNGKGEDGGEESAQKNGNVNSGSIEEL